MAENCTSKQQTPPRILRLKCFSQSGVSGINRDPVFHNPDSKQNTTDQVSRNSGVRDTSQKNGVSGFCRVQKDSVHDMSVKQILRSDLNLDTHPAVTRLQNEQNLRLEGMEQRMKKIRKSAQQEAERRKFALLFRAKVDTKSQTEKLLKEASLALEQLKHEKQMKKSMQQNGVPCLNSLGVDSLRVGAFEEGDDKADKGEIIPVHVVPDTTSGRKEKVPCEEKPPLSQVKQPLMWLLQPVETFQLDGLKLWLILPFLLPVLLLLHMIQHFSPHSDSRSRKKN